MKFEQGVVKEPIFCVLYGTPSVGKTEFAAQAPNPIFMDPEKGSRKHNVARKTDFANWSEVVEMVKFLRNDKDHKFQSLAIDTLDHLEPLVWQEVCARDPKGPAVNIEKSWDGFQKGYLVAIDVWKEFINQLRDLRTNRNMNIIALAHPKVQTINDPMTALPYERYTLKLHENKQSSAIALWKESVDAMLFATYEDTVYKVKDGDKKAKASGGEIRKLYTTRTAMYDAKNRYGLPSEIPFTYGRAWQDFIEAVDRGQPDSVETIKADIDRMLGLFDQKDKDVAARMKKAKEAAGDDYKKLLSIRNHARGLEEKLS